MTELTECEKMKMFIDDNYAFEYILWEDKILPMNTSTAEERGIIDIELEDE